MTNTSDPLFREVDEAVQRDRLHALWNEYRRPIIAAVIAMIGFSIGMSQWHTYQEQKAGRAMEQFSAAQDLYAQEKYMDAANDFAALATQPATPEIADMAHLWQARALIAAKKEAEAIALLVALAEHPQSTKLVWRDLACLRLVTLDASKNTCLDADANSPLATQRKLVQVAHLWESQKSDEARSILEALIADPNTPQSTRISAQNFLSVLPAPAKIAAQQTPVIPTTEPAK